MSLNAEDLLKWMESEEDAGPVPKSNPDLASRAQRRGPDSHRWTNQIWPMVPRTGHGRDCVQTRLYTALGRNLDAIRTTKLPNINLI